ncbi:hypothetical protein TNCV_1281751 [Trichonephila clavipes]|nr:hypothetical protein TNCV_1281751 [Trichonephila clavipes]
MDAMKLSIRLLGNTCFPPPKVQSLQVSDSSRRPWSRRNASSRYIPNMLDWIQVRRHAGNSIRCIVSASSMFSTRRALCGRALSSGKQRISMAPA